MNGSVVRRVCCVVGTDVVITVGVGLVHWSDILTTVTARPATSAAPTTPATDTAVVLRYHAPRSSGSGVGEEPRAPILASDRRAASRAVHSGGNEHE